jgi:integrase
VRTITARETHMAGTARHELPFNRQAVDKAGPRGGKLTEWKIATVPGLTLVVQPTGVSTYFVRYQVWHGTKRVFRRVKLGDRKLVTLSEARTRATDIMRKVEAGEDPVSVAKTSSAALTFRQIAEDRLAGDVAISTRTRNEYSAMLRHDVFPAIGDVPAGEVSREAVAAILHSVEKRGALRHSDHIKSAISSTYRWAMRRGLVGANPTLGLGRRSSTVARTRVLTEDELKSFWRALDRDDAGLSWPVRTVLKLAFLTGQRRLEVVGARRSELRDLDGPAPTWIIPGDDKRGGKVIEGRTKNGKEQRVPLSKQAAALFRDAIARAGNSECVFPTDTKKVRIGKQSVYPHIHGDSITVGMRRLCFVIGLEGASVHDARRCIATWLGERGVRPDVIDAILNHAPKVQDITRRHYNHAVLAEPVGASLQAWADHVEAVARGSGAGGAEDKVVQLRG